MGVGSRYLEDEPKKVPVHFLALQSDVVVLPQLVVPVHSSHVGIVQCHCCKTWHIYPPPIMLTASHKILLLWLCVCGQKTDNPVVTPQQRHHSIPLDDLCVSSTRERERRKDMHVYTCTCIHVCTSEYCTCKCVVN